MLLNIKNCKNHIITYVITILSFISNKIYPFYIIIVAMCINLENINKFILKYNLSKQNMKK